jgi:GNAT superfamily N-acetyltransferase
MGRPLDQQELRRRAVEGVRDEVEAFGSAAASSLLIRREGLLAAVVPASPQRSLFNSVYYDDPAALAAEAEALEEAYRSHGVRAWTVWVPEEDRESARLLAARGHAMDAAPRAMAMELESFDLDPVRPDGIVSGPIDAATCARLNDAAYGFGDEGFSAGLSGETAIRWHGAFAGGEAVSCVGAIEVGEDCCITGVATPSAWRGKGIASWLLCQTLAGARESGLTSASLQASRAGAPIYERLGFADHGSIEMWELRR